MLYKDSLHHIHYIHFFACFSIIIIIKIYFANIQRIISLENNKLDICCPLVKSPQYEKNMLISDVAYSRYYRVFTNVRISELKYNDLEKYKIVGGRGYVDEK